MNQFHSSCEDNEIVSQPVFSAFFILRQVAQRSVTTMSKAAVSFEFFPPNDDAMGRQLRDTVTRLAPLRPRFVSVTYGAAGANRTKTVECVQRLQNETSLHVVPHLTCAGASREEVLGIAQHYWRHGIRHLVALRGDLPESTTNASTITSGSCHFTYASDLVRELASTVPFELSVAAYPEGHPESNGVEADIENLRRKVDAGAHRAITQFFFDTDVFLRYRDRCVSAGIGIPIVPGILPILRFPAMVRFAARCGASVPDLLHKLFDRADDDAEAAHRIALTIAIDMVQRLRSQGVEEFHFYTLNRAELTSAICNAIGLRPQINAAVSVA